MHEQSVHLPAVVAAQYAVSSGACWELKRACSWSALAANCGVLVAATSSSDSAVLAAVLVEKTHWPYRLLCRGSRAEGPATHECTACSSTDACAQK